MGGFVGGMIAGAVVVVVLGAVLSLNAPLSKKPSIATVAPEPAPVQTSESSEVVAEAGADADLLKLPAQTPENEVEEEDSLAGLSEAENAPDSQPVVNDVSVPVEAPTPSEADSVSISSEAPVVPRMPVPVQPAPLADLSPDAAEDAPEPPADQVALAEPLPEVSPSESIELEVNPEDNPIAVEGDEDTLPSQPLPRIASVPQIGAEDNSSGNTTIGRRVVPLTERDDEAAQDPQEEVPVGKPIEAFAEKFDNPDSKPLMSIILIDDEGAYGAEALQDFPYPLTFAVRPSDPDAAEKMARHRAAGFEVMVTADLPKAASAQDAEVSLSVWLEALPETVGILEGDGSGIQGNRKLADQVAAIAGGTGRGLITQDNGLNTVQKLASRNGIPSAVIFRDIDGARQDAKIMRRFLDQAAFRAGQEGTVVMLGRLRPDTISALLLWGLEDRGGRVAMAPISAVMMQGAQ